MIWEILYQGGAGSTAVMSACWESFLLHTGSTATSGSQNLVGKWLCCPMGITWRANLLDDKVTFCWRLSQRCRAAKSRAAAQEKTAIFVWRQLTVPHLPLINSKTNWCRVHTWREFAFSEDNAFWINGDVSHHCLNYVQYYSGERELPCKSHKNLFNRSRYFLLTSMVVGFTFKTNMDKNSVHIVFAVSQKPAVSRVSCCCLAREFVFLY